jgi:hypothetical protein
MAADCPPAPVAGYAVVGGAAANLRLNPRGEPAHGHQGGHEAATETEAMSIPTTDPTPTIVPSVTIAHRSKSLPEETNCRDFGHSRGLA